MPESLIARPTLTGTMHEAPGYTNMGVGFTDRVWLIGHADGLSLNDPYQVLSMKEAVRTLGQDPNDPLLRGLLEAYYSGARDIWLVAAAPLSEYVEETERLDDDYYYRYYERLEATYATLKEFELPQVLVPLNAPLNATAGIYADATYGYQLGTPVDFVSQLADHCLESLDLTNAVRLGVLGTERLLTDADALMGVAEHFKTASFGAGGKFVLPVVGSCVYNIQETISSHVGPPTAIVAATIAQLPLNLGMTNTTLPQAITTVQRDYTAKQLETLCNARLNPVVRSTKSKRGQPFDVRLLTDNLLAEPGSDFWSVAQMHLVQIVIENLRAMGNRHLGTVGFPMFRDSVNKYMDQLSSQGVLRGFTVKMERTPSVETHRFSETIDVNVSLQPYFGVRTLTFQTTVGPGA